MRFTFKRLGLLCGKAARACARVVGLTSARLDFLTILLDHERIQVQIASILCVTEPVVSVMVRELERLGWVSRRRAPYDRRCKIVSLTDKGRAWLAPHLDAELRLDPTGQRSAQCEGEAAWTRDWDRPMKRIGLCLDEFFEPHVADSLFRAMQRWNKTHTYAEVFDWWSEHPAHPAHPPATA